MSEFRHKLDPFHELSWCLVCKGTEGTLPTRCPERTLTHQEADDIYAGRIDFDTGPMNPIPVWWVARTYLEENKSHVA